MPDVLGGFVFHVKGRAAASAASGVGRGKGLAFAQALARTGCSGRRGGGRVPHAVASDLLALKVIERFLFEKDATRGGGTAPPGQNQAENTFFRETKGRMVGKAKHFKRKRLREQAPPARRHAPVRRPCGTSGRPWHHPSARPHRDDSTCRGRIAPRQIPVRRIC